MADEARAGAVEGEDRLARFGRDIRRENLMPLWERTTPQRPGGPALPRLWRYAETRPRLLEAARLITKRAAERRVLVLENPAFGGTGFVAPTLYAGLQIILPGEIAPAHRHTQNALRLFIEGDGAYTSVAGERVAMRPGDFVVTPSWDWHDHGNLGAGPCVWLDGLDTPLAQIFGAIFREDYPAEVYPITRSDGASDARYGAALLPLDPAHGTASPLLIYRYERTRAALASLAAGGGVHPAHGAKLRYANPATGGHAFPTLAAFAQLLPAGFAGAPHRSTESTVLIVVEGEGEATVGGERFVLAPHDVLVVPSWETRRFSATRELVLFSFSDRAAQEALGFFREDANGR